MRKLQILLAVVIIVAVAIVLVAPSVDLDPSALRAVRAAALIFLAIFIAGSCLADRRLVQAPESFLRFNSRERKPIVFSDADLLDLYCSRLC